MRTEESGMKKERITRKAKLREIEFALWNLAEQNGPRTLEKRAPLNHSNLCILSKIYQCVKGLRIRQENSSFFFFSFPRKGAYGFI